MIKGKEAEEKAINFLRSLGYIILFTNFRFKKYEIDIICKKDDTIIIVEVKYSINNNFIVKKKQIKNLFTVVENIFSNNFCRFDVIFINKTINHIQNAYVM